MPVEDRKDTIAFIICVNNELYFEECKYYIEHLEVSAGYDIDVIGIWEADSMCAAYNLGMRSSDAKYKVYMHQDVFIRDSRFLEKTLRIFKEHPKTGDDRDGWRNRHSGERRRLFFLECGKSGLQGAGSFLCPAVRAEPD